MPPTIELELRESLVRSPISLVPRKRPMLPLMAAKRFHTRSASLANLLLDYGRHQFHFTRHL